MTWRIALYENRYACGSSLFILSLLTAILAMALCMAPGCNMCGNGCEGIFNVEPTELGAFSSVQSIIELPARHRRMVFVNNRTASLLPTGGEFVPGRGGESFIPFQREQLTHTEPSLAYMTGSGSTLSLFFFGVNDGAVLDVGVNVSSFKDVFVDDSSVWMLTTDGHLLRTSLDHPNTTQALSLAQSCQTRAYIIPPQVQTGGGVLVLCNSQLVSVTGTTVLSATNIDLSVGSPINYRYGATRWVTLAEGSSYVIFNVPAVVISTVAQQLPNAYPTHLARENYELCDTEGLVWFYNRVTGDAVVFTFRGLLQDELVRYSIAVAVGQSMICNLQQLYLFDPITLQLSAVNLVTPV